MSKTTKTFRFDLLSNDVDLDEPLFKRPGKEKAIKQEPEPTKKPIAKPNQKTVKKKQEKESLQALAFGNPKSKKKTVVASNQPSPLPSKSSGCNNVSLNKKVKGSSNNVCNGIEQNDKSKALSEDWKNRDEQFVEEENERELREALMLSKLDYEANKDIYIQTEEANKSLTKTKKKKKDKPLVLTLSEFNTMDSRRLSGINGSGFDGTVINISQHKQNKGANKDNTTARDNNFFAEVDQTVRNTIIKETRQKQYDDQLKKQKVSNIDGQKSPSKENTGIQLVPISELEKRDFEIQALRLEVENLKDQLEKVKIRNKKLCEVLGTAEMRSLSEMVLELDKVSRARDEFSAEVATLSEQLEQEKTKVSLLQDKGRKK